MMSKWGCNVCLVFYSENRANGLAFYLQSGRMFYFENDGVPGVFCIENIRGASCFEIIQVVFCFENDDRVFCSENDDGMFCSENDDGVFCSENNDGVFCSENVNEVFCFEKDYDSVEFFSTSCVCSYAFEERRHFSLNHRTF